MFLKEGVPVVISFGPFVDKTDGVTLETGLVSALDNATTGIKLSKGGAAQAVRSATVTASTYDAHGCYLVTLSATDTASVGRLRVIYTDAATCLPVWQDFVVLPTQVFNSLVAGSDVLDTNVTKWLDTACATPTTAGVPEVDVTYLNGGTTSLLNLIASATTIIRGTVDTTAFTATTTELEADDITEATADHYVGRLIGFVSSGELGQVVRITAYTLASGRGHFTYTTMVGSAPANNDTFVII
jgi:hypothetical protein